MFTYTRELGQIEVRDNSSCRIVDTADNKTHEKTKPNAPVKQEKGDRKNIVSQGYQK